MRLRSGAFSHSTYLHRVVVSKMDRNSTLGGTVPDPTLSLFREELFDRDTLECFFVEGLVLLLTEMGMRMAVMTAMRHWGGCDE